MPRWVPLTACLAGVVLLTSCAIRWPLAMKNGAQSLYLGNDRGAEEHFTQALAIAEKAGPDDPRIPMSLEALSAVYYQQGRLERAEPLVRRAMRLREERDGATHPELVYALLGLYHIAVLDPARDEEAEAYLARFESILAASPDYEPRGWEAERLLMALVVAEAGRARLRQGRYDAADTLYRNALDRFERLGRGTYGLSLPAIDEYAEVLQMTGREDEIPALLARFDLERGAADDYLAYATASRRGERNRPARWRRAQMPLRVHLPLPEEGSCAEPDAVVDVAMDAILAWQDVVEPGLPSFEFVAERSEADIPIVWLREQTGHAIGRARVRPSGGGRIWVESVEMVLRYGDGTEAPLDYLYVVLMHEMGHALGLIGHSPYPTDIMCARASGCLVGRIEGLTDRDRRTLQRLYDRRDVSASRAPSL